MVGAMLMVTTVAGGTAAQAQTTATPADALVEPEIKDQHGFAEYGAPVPATIAQHGGAVIVNAAAETIEGAAPEGRVIVTRLGSLAGARGWLQSSDDTPLKGIRHRMAERRQLLVEGLPGD
jgi:uncharacterized protein (DUF1330 family)